MQLSLSLMRAEIKALSLAKGEAAAAEVRNAAAR
jgi:hypothetical protein